MYHSVQDAHRYLSESIIQFKGEPVYIGEVRDNWRATVYPLTGAPLFQQSLKDKNFDFSPVPLGYGLDPKDKPTYLARQPARMWKQGLTDKNLLNIGHEGRIRVRTTHDWQSLRDVILGNFKPLDEVILKGGVLTREFYVSPVLNVFFMGYKIGQLNGRKVVLSPDYSFMDKYVEDVFKCK